VSSRRSIFFAACPQALSSSRLSQNEESAPDSFLTRAGEVIQDVILQHLPRPPTSLIMRDEPTVADSYNIVWPVSVMVYIHCCFTSAHERKHGTEDFADGRNLILRDPIAEF